VDVRVTDALGATFDDTFTITVSEPVTPAANVGKAMLYTGTGAALSVTGAGISPDLVAIKARDATTVWRWTDNVRGPTLSVDSSTGFA
jgi:hypothetical protein